MKRENGEWIMHGLFVDDMIHTSTSEELKRKFIKEFVPKCKSGTCRKLPVRVYANIFNRYRISGPGYSFPLVLRGKVRIPFDQA